MHQAPAHDGVGFMVSGIGKQLLFMRLKGLNRAISYNKVMERKWKRRIFSLGLGVLA